MKKHYKVTRTHVVEAESLERAWAAVAMDDLGSTLTLVTVQEVTVREQPYQSNGWGEALKHQILGDGE
jgi:hypothetical protein